MSKAKSKGGAPALPPADIELEGYAEPPVAEAISPPVVEAVAVLTGPRTYAINLRHFRQDGQPMAHDWLPWCVEIDGCDSEEGARKKLHDTIDSAVFQIQARY